MAAGTSWSNAILIGLDWKQLCFILSAGTFSFNVVSR